MKPIMKYISRIHRCAASYRLSALSGEGMTGGGQLYLAEICRRPGISQEQLTKRLCVNKSSVTRQLGRLEQSGFITRHSDPRDGRVSQVFPTKEAEALLPKIKEVSERWNELLAGELSEKEKKQLASMLKRVSLKAAALIGAQDAPGGDSH